MPFPGSLVVKKGSKILDLVSASIPWPVSERLSRMCGTRERAPVALGVFLVQLHHGGFNEQPAPVGHGVTRVDGEIEQCLRQLPGVALELAAGPDRGG